MDHAVELRHLRYFLAVAAELHFGRAAEELEIAQPALSQQIRRLEQLLGTALFARTSRRVALTPAGVVLQQRAGALLQQADAALEETRRVGRGELGRLDVGSVPSAVALGAAERILRFRRGWPAVQLQLHEGSTAHLADRLVAGTLDVAVLRDVGPRPGLTRTAILVEPFVAVVPADSPYAQRPVVAPAELRDEAFVFFPRSAGDHAHRANLAPALEAGYEPRVTQEASSWPTILQLVGAGLGVTLAPSSATVGAPATARVVPLSGSGSRSRVDLVHRSDDVRAVVQHFLS